MTTFHNGMLNAKNKKFAIVVTRFNDFFSNHLLNAALDTIERHQGSLDDVDVFRIPGCFEIPVMTDKIAASKKYDAIICLGVLIRGETPHFDYISAECTKGIAQLALTYHTPITYGVITVEDLDQAINRSGAKAGNKGAEAALAAIEMADLFASIP